jgi:hypothetical protein
VVLLYNARRISPMCEPHYRRNKNCINWGGELVITLTTSNFNGAVNLEKKIALSWIKTFLLVAFFFPKFRHQGSFRTPHLCIHILYQDTKVKWWHKIIQLDLEDTIILCITVIRMFYGSSGFRKYMIKSSHKYLHAITKKKKDLFYFIFG